MTKYCLACGRNVEFVSKDENFASFNIVQATSVVRQKTGAISAKRESTTYICSECAHRKNIRWDRLILYNWVDEQVESRIG